MAVEILDEAMLRIAPADRAAEQLGSGYGGPDGPTEGPIWIHEGGYLLFSDIHGSQRYKWHPKRRRHPAQGRHRERQRHDARPAGAARRLPPPRPLRRSRGSGRLHHHHRRPLSRPALQPAERRGRAHRRQHLLHRSAAAPAADAARPSCGARHRRRLPRLARPRARQHDHPQLRQPERALLLARRENPLRQRF